MGFDCIECEKHEIWAFESSTRPNLCWPCEERLYGETEEMREHKELNKWTQVNGDAGDIEAASGINHASGNAQQHTKQQFQREGRKNI